MLKSIENLISALEETQILYCHWKSNEHLVQALEGDTDLDVLFDPTQRNQLEIVLCQCGLKRFRATPNTQYNAIEDFIGLDSGTGKIWHLHTHYKMTLGMELIKEYTVTPWTKMILNNRRKDESGIYCSSIEHELILLVVRMALKLRIRDKNKKINPHDIREFTWLKERVNTDKCMKVAKEMVGEDVALMILDVVHEGLLSNKQLSRIRHDLKKYLSPFTGYSDLETRYIRTKREIFVKIGKIKRRLGLNIETPYRRISPSSGLLVSFVGFKPTGENNLMLDVQKEFRKKIDVTSVSFNNRVCKQNLLKKIIVKILAPSDKFKSITKSRNNGILVLTDGIPKSNILRKRMRANLPDLLITGPNCTHDIYTMPVENHIEIDPSYTHKDTFLTVMMKIWELI